jgi:hypothetical protein
MALMKAAKWKITCILGNVGDPRDPDLGIYEDIQAALPSVSPLKNFLKIRGNDVEKKTFPKISTPQKTTRNKNMSTPKKINTKETASKKTTLKKRDHPEEEKLPHEKQAKTTPKKNDDVDMIQSR